MAVIPDSNVDLTTNIGQVLRDAGGSVDINDAQTFFTAGAKINQWSKHKPVILNKIHRLTEDDFKAVAYGLSYSVSSNLHVKWTYNIPTGGESSPYRLSDFIKYDTNMVSGLQFTQDSYSKDIYSSNSGLTVGLYTDSSMITVRDFSDTLFSGCQIRIDAQSYDSTTTYTYYSEYEDVSSSSLQWTIPRDALVKLNVGKSTIAAEVRRPDGIKFYPLIKDMTFLTITANTGATVSSWGYSMTVGTSTSNMVNANYYQPGVSRGVPDLTGGNNILFSFGAIRNNTVQILSATNTYILLTYRDSNGNDVQKRVNLYAGSRLDTWTLSVGSTKADFFGIRYENMPTLTNGTAVSYAVQVNLTNNGINGYYTITDTIKMITKKA